VSSPAHATKEGTNAAVFQNSCVPLRTNGGAHLSVQNNPNRGTESTHVETLWRTLINSIRHRLIVTSHSTVTSSRHHLHIHSVFALQKSTPVT